MDKLSLESFRPKGVFAPMIGSFIIGYLAHARNPYGSFMANIFAYAFTILVVDALLLLLIKKAYAHYKNKD